MARERNMLKLLSNAECKSAYEKAVQSALRHRIKGVSSAASSDYGMAISHLILGTEELSKGILFYFQALEVDVKNVPKVHLFFTDHIIKHRLAVFVHTMFAVIKPFMGMVYKIREELHNPNAEVNYTETEKAFMNKDEEKIKVLFSDIPGMFDWWDEANIKKNEGFYVDYTTKLISPQDITKPEFDVALKLTDEFREKIDELISYFEKRTEEELIEFKELVKANDFTSILKTITLARAEEMKKYKN
jgi:AbiV family abortive infection protein